MAYKAVVKRVVDGDTFEGDLIVVEINVVYPDRKFRLFGVDTPERDELLYGEAKSFTKNLIEFDAFDVEIHGKKNGVDNFSRYLVTVKLPDGTDLGQRLIDEGLAEVWKG